MGFEKGSLSFRMFFAQRDFVEDDIEKFAAAFPRGASLDTELLLPILKTTLEPKEVMDMLPYHRQQVSCGYFF